MKTYLSLILIDLRLATRQKSVLFFNYLMPMIFFFVFAQSMHAEQGGAILQVVSMVTVIGILGNGLFGAGMRAVQEREANILRRYKVTPIGPLPLLAASTVTGLVVYLPYVVIMFALAHFKYGMVLPEHLASVFIFISLGVVAIRSIGLIVAATVNSMQESGILVQILYMTMLFLSGTTFPTSMFPDWLQSAAQIIPATHLISGLGGLITRNETLAQNWKAATALAMTACVGTFLAVKLFRWEKEEKMRSSAKLWILAVMVPFVALGAWDMKSKENVTKSKLLERDLMRSKTRLFRNGRIIIGNGKVIENGAVLVKNGKIEAVYDGNIPDPKTLNADAVEAAGKTILPGLIDMHVHLTAPGGFLEDWSKYDAAKAMQRNLSSYLFSGVTAVRSVGDPDTEVLKIRARTNSGEKLGAELFTCGPLFTVAGGHGTEYFKNMPANQREGAEREFTRQPRSAEEARTMVSGLKAENVDCIKAVMESGAGGTVYNRLDPLLLKAIAGQAAVVGLPLAVHTGDSRDMMDAIEARANGIEHGSFRDKIADGIFQAMAKAEITYDPTLSVGEAFPQFAAGKLDLLSRSLVQQAAPKELLAGTKRMIESPVSKEMRKAIGDYPIDMAVAKVNLLHAMQLGVPLIVGSDAGNMLVFHGPTVQHELQLWVEAGVPIGVALQAATLNAARALRADKRIGSIEKGKDATLLMVDGNPLENIKALEAISYILFKGEHVNRAELFEDDDKN